MDDYILKTIIFIMKDTKTNQPVVVSHFQGFKDDSEAKNFSEFFVTVIIEIFKFLFNLFV